MKNVFARFSGLILTLLLVFSLLPQQAHAAGAGLSASSSYLRAGNSFTVYLSVSGSNVAGIEASMTYDSATLTYNGYSNSIGGSWVLSESSRYFTMYNSAGDTFSGNTRLIALSFTVKSSASPGASLSVSVSGKASENGSDSSFSAYWSDEVLAPLSGNANLDDLWCNNATLDFTGSTEYSITVPYEVSSLSLDWSRAHSGSSVSVSGNSLSVGSNTVTVTVEAENGNVKRYYIYVTRQQDPNYVPSTDADLSSLSLSAGTLSPAFRSDVTEYVVYLPYEITSLTAKASANDSKAKSVTQTRKVLMPVVLPDAESAPAAGETTEDPAPVEPQYETLAEGAPLPDGESLHIITCTAEDGTTTKDYTIHVIRMPLFAGVLPEIIPPVTEPVEPEPEPEPTTYDISLPLVLTLPYVGEVTLQQAALGALIALGVLLLLLLLIVWLIGRRGGRKKALRQMAKANAQSDAPADSLPEQAAAQAPAEASDPDAKESQAPDEKAVDSPEESVEPVAEPTAPELPAEETCTEEIAPEAPSADEEPTEPMAEEPSSAVDAAPEPVPAEDAAAPAASDDPAAMSLDALLEDIRNM